MTPLLEASSELSHRAFQINPGLKEKVWASEGQRQVAFNQDLSVRPDWLAPSPLGPMLAIAGWWEPQSVTDEGLILAAFLQPTKLQCTCLSPSD